jgi:hypothetical protein
MPLLKVEGEFTTHGRAERKGETLVVLRARAWGGGKGEEATTIWVDLQGWSSSVAAELLELEDKTRLWVVGELLLRRWNDRDYYRVSVSSVRRVEAKKAVETKVVVEEADGEMPF